jgi:class 3 adenylate cyclase
MPDLLEAGREAARKNLWSEAVAALTAADSNGSLSGDDLILLGDALWWSGRPDEANEVFERAFVRLEREDRYSDAASIGARLAYFALRQLSMSVAGGWLARVERLLEGKPESVGHGWLKILYLAKALMVDNDFSTATTLADETIAIGQRFAVPGIEALAMSMKGIILVHTGEWRRGISLIDESTVVATSDAGDLRAAGDVYCNTIAVCRSLGDYRRAGEWTDKADRWLHDRALGGYPGICQVHRAELKRLRGSWSEAEREARQACIELERFHIMDGLGFAQYEIGEVRRRMGDLVSAETAFLRAYEYGHDAQPGLSLLLLNQGEVEEASRSIAGAIQTLDRAASADLLSRARLLPAQVEIALAAGNPEMARQALAELDRISTEYEGPTWTASSLTCRGALLLYEGHPDQAVDPLGRAWRLWSEVGLPYESAQARVLLGRARLALGESGPANLEFRAAASTFQQLGAVLDLRRLQELTGVEAMGTLPRERVTKVFAFTDIVTSTDLIGLIGDDAWQNLLRWHDRALREAISRAGGEEVRHTGDGFFVAFDHPRAAIDWAVTVQRMLGEHRRVEGFAPWVRIGLHRAEATREGGDYSGQGVHAAARVGALAGKEEILASSLLLEAAGPIPYPTSEARTVALKGISEPMPVQSIEWRSPS